MTEPLAARRISSTRLEQLAEQCSKRDLAVLGSLRRLRLASGLQLERLHFGGLGGRSRSVTRWRVLKRLTDWRLILPLERRVGGSARGSAGLVYTLAQAGWRLLLRLRPTPTGRTRYAEPGERKVKHTLAVTELYTRLVERSRTGDFRLVRFKVEPRFPLRAGWLCPDAYAVVATPQVVDHWWIEVDRATESVSTVLRKLDAYASCYEGGGWAELGVMPRVLVSVPNDRRRQQVLARLSANQRILVDIELQPASAEHIAQTAANVHS